MIFIHGWPGNGLIWRAQMEAFAGRGWHCVAPDMRGYGGSSRTGCLGAYAIQKRSFSDMIELHDRYLGRARRSGMGHDLGSPVAGALAAHHPANAAAVWCLISVPYLPEGFGLPSLVPSSTKTLYPADQYPAGQWDYYRFYLTDFDQTVERLRRGHAERPSPQSIGQRNPDGRRSQSIGTALITSGGGWFGSARRAPPTLPT